MLSAVHAHMQLLCSTTSEFGDTPLHMIEGKLVANAGAVGHRWWRCRQRSERRHRETLLSEAYAREEIECVFADFPCFSENE